MKGKRAAKAGLCRFARLFPPASESSQESEEPEEVQNGAVLSQIAWL